MNSLLTYNVFAIIIAFAGCVFIAPAIALRAGATPVFRKKDMQPATKLALAEALNATGFKAEMLETDEIKQIIGSEMEDFFTYSSQHNGHDKAAVLADMNGQTPDQIRCELSFMGFARRLGDKNYTIVAGHEWEAYIASACKEANSEAATA